MPAVGALSELGRRLRSRREEAGLAVDDLAKAAGLAATAVLKYEQGAGNLGVASLLRVASVLGVAVGELVSTGERETRARVNPIVLLRTRGVVSLDNKDEEALAKAVRRGTAFSSLGELLCAENLSSNFAPSTAPEYKPHEAGYLSASKTRLLIGRAGPLRNLWRLIEERFNILVIRLKFVNPAVEGAAARSGNGRVICVGSAVTSEARCRFVLAHELAHHLLDLGEDDVRADDRPLDSGFSLENPPDEKRANAFAAMLLAPRDAVRVVLGEPRAEHSIDAARELVERSRLAFGLSAPAMGWHLLNLGYIAHGEVVRAATAAPPKETDGFEEEPRLDGLDRRVREALAKDVISAGRARELLGFSPHEQIPDLG
jgi:Zn-dependent peptidase ImmA (M78 family)/transcriptional regulator with XRE-family HTH domain